MAGLPDTVGGVQLNRFCASGLEAVNTAAQKVRSGWDDLVLAGGVESMSRVPMGSDGGAWATDPATNYDIDFVPQGIGADLIATIEGFSREDVDAYAVRSQEQAAAAWSGGYFAKSVVPVKDQNGLVILDHDEHMRPGTTRREPWQAEDRVRRHRCDGRLRRRGAAEVPLRREDQPRPHRRQQLRHRRRRRAGARRQSRGRGKSQGLTPRARIVATATSGADSDHHADRPDAGHPARCSTAPA